MVPPIRPPRRALFARNPETLGDIELVELTRKGQSDAFAVLWKRHAAPGRAVAQGCSSGIDPDDIVAESFTKIFNSIQEGKGPTSAFRAYLFTTIRNTAASWGRSSREASSDVLDELADPTTLEDASLAALDLGLTASAFRSLPTRWQEALWYSEVESMSAQQIAPLLGMKPNAVSALTFRAREGLRQAWIQAHISSVPANSDCRWAIDHMGGHARGGLGVREQTRLDDHLLSCSRCAIISTEAKEVGSRLALILLPIAAGVGGAAAYTLWSQTEGSSLLMAVAPVGPPPAVITTALGGRAVGVAATSGAWNAVLVAGAAVVVAGGVALGVGAFVNSTTRDTAVAEAPPASHSQVPTAAPVPTRTPAPTPVPTATPVPTVTPIPLAPPTTDTPALFPVPTPGPSSPPAMCTPFV